MKSVIYPTREWFRASPAFLGLLFALAGGGCQDKQAATKATAADAGAPRKSGVDKNIEEAVEAVAGGADDKAAGPPPTGVFANAAAADKEFRAGEPPKLSLGNKGSEPFVTFGAPKAGKKLDAKMEVSIQTGPRSAMPTMELALSLEGATEKAAEPGAAPAPVEAFAKVTSSKLSADQPGELPPGLDKQIGMVKGSRLQLATSATGSRVAGIEPAKGLDESLNPVLGAAADTLEVALLPYPTEPVGVGAFWLVTSRETFVGLDVIVYRMVKLTGITGDGASIEVSAKRYMAGGKLAFAGLPPHRIQELRGDGTTKMTVVISDPSITQGENADVLLANLVPEGAPPGGPQGQQKMPIHIEQHTRFGTKR